jgi:CheY-like chemotaxis protein
MKVMIAEDNALISLALETLVEDLGHTCASPAATAGEALEIARAEAPDLAIVDLGLADGWAGDSLVDELHALGLVSLIVSGQAEYYEPPAHVAAVFTKPVNEKALAAEIARIARDGAGDASG